MSKRPYQEPLDKASREAAENASKTVMEGLARYREPERQEWITMVATLAISLMHGTYGAKFTDGYLNAARESLRDPDEAFPLKVEESPLQ